MDRFARTQEVTAVVGRNWTIGTGFRDVRILGLRGEFDAADVPGVAGRVDAALSSGAVRLVVNLAGVEFASAAVLGCLLAARARARRRGGDVVLSAPSGFVRRMLRLLRLDAMLEVFPGDAEAVRRLLAVDRRGPGRRHVSLERVRGGAVKPLRARGAHASPRRGLAF
jgi:anti-anti-sigma factor